MELKGLHSEIREALDPKISESREEKELSNSEYRNILQEQLALIKSTPLEALREQNNQIMQEAREYKSGLTENEKEKIKEAHPDWPDEVIDAMGSREEQEQLTLVKSTPLEALREQNNQIMQEAREYKSGLTEDEKEKIKEAHPDWPDDVIDAIKTKEEYEIYKNAGLEGQEINGKPCLIRTDIDMEQKDALGRTNQELMNQGLSPVAKNGETVELHHIGQKSDSPLAELTVTEHRGKGNDAILHDKKQVTQIDRVEFKGEKETHWETRAKQD
jgi:FtsZ-binding cell division protein ZapB